MANTVIQLKKSATPSAVPTNLANGELALNFADGKLFYKAANGTIVEYRSADGLNFGTVNANGTLIVSDTNNDVFSLAPGDGINIVGDAINDVITISANLSGYLRNTTGTFAGTLTITDDLIVRGNATLGDAATDRITINGNSISLGNNQSIDTGTMFIDATNNRVGITTTSPAYTLEVAGSFAAQTKSFVINHPTKPNMKLRYGSLEGPENGIYIRGKVDRGNTIDLPNYWKNLIDLETITVNITPIGKKQELYVKKVTDETITIGGARKATFYYIIFAERKDVEKLIVEY